MFPLTAVLLHGIVAHGMAAMVSGGGDRHGAYHPSSFAIVITIQP